SLRIIRVVVLARSDGDIREGYFHIYLPLDLGAGAGFIRCVAKNVLSRHFAGDVRNSFEDRTRNCSRVSASSDFEGVVAFVRRSAQESGYVLINVLERILDAASGFFSELDQVRVAFA